jgi:FAD-dependent monooxygenase
LRQRIHEHYQAHDGENKDFGIEMGYIYQSNIVHTPESDGIKPDWQAAQYTPSTWPGSRAPHVFLSDGSAVFDHLGKDWSLVTFTETNADVEVLLTAASALAIPIEHVDLRGEHEARRLWERDLVLVRPDEHVAWRSNSVGNIEEARSILEVAIGFKPIDPAIENGFGRTDPLGEKFITTMEMKTQVRSYELEQMGEFQQ